MFNQDRQSIVEEYLSEIKIEDYITYIKSQLPKISPDISTDFQHFLDTYYASKPSSSQYQELIGFRSTMYFRLIFAVAEGYGISHPRRNQIEAFIYGKNIVHDLAVDATIKAGKKLYDELSDQDPFGYSVKIGKVSSNYVKLTFNKIMITFETLLKQREMHFKP